MSGESVAYHLRQNKHVDRQLFVEILSHVTRSYPVRKSLYVSFGGVYFEDFKLIHNVFGTEKLLSIEQDPWVMKRQKHNKPFGCIRCEELKSRALVTNINDYRTEFRDPQLICWLDFASTNRRAQLEDVSILLKNSRAGDVIRVTMNANPGTLGEQREGELVAERDTRRLATLRQKLGDKLPGEVDEKDITVGAFPALLLRMLKLEMSKAMESQPDLQFQPLGSYSYCDAQHTMLTVTGIILETKNIKAFLQQTRIREFNFAGLEWELQHINVPLLSQREKLKLDQKYKTAAPSRISRDLGFQVAKTKSDSDAMLRDYFDFHRYYPHFHRIQY
jgi:hypothetical protein